MNNADKLAENWYNEIGKKLLPFNWSDELKELVESLMKKCIF